MKATLWQHLAASIGRVLPALLAAIMIGIPLGLWMGMNKWVRAVVDPLIELLRPIRPLAYLPLLVIWFGIGETTKILLIFFSVLAPVIISSAHGVSSHQLNRERAALALGASRMQVFRHALILPPHYRTSSPASASVWAWAGRHWWPPSWWLPTGASALWCNRRPVLITDTVILGIIVIAVVAVALELLLRNLQKQLSPWYGQQL